MDGSIAIISGSCALLNGVEFAGLAVDNPNISPPQLTIEVTGAAATYKFAFVLNLQGS
jgi:hypothetical protein